MSVTIPLNDTENARGICHNQLNAAKHFILVTSQDGRSWGLTGSYMEDDLPILLGHVMRLSIAVEAKKVIGGQNEV